MRKYMKDSSTVHVYEIFKSINGEVCKNYQGSICTFIRVSGCNLRCSYCDTRYAQHEHSGKVLTIREILTEVKDGPTNVTITGGEPLRQANLYLLVQGLKDLKKRISIETNGSVSGDYCQLPIGSVDINWVVDYKLTGSKQNQFMFDAEWYVNRLGPNDFLKFVVKNRRDFDQACRFLNQTEGKLKATVAFSPVIPKVPPRNLLLWMREEKLWDCILNLQLHKLIGVS